MKTGQKGAGKKVGDELKMDGLRRGESEDEPVQEENVKM